jgi:hypothetical protein
MWGQENGGGETGDGLDAPQFFDSPLFTEARYAECCST